METPSQSPQLTEQVKDEAKGFIGSLFDFSFESFITPKIIKLIYGLFLVGVCMSALVFLVRMAASGVMGFLVGLIATPIILVIGLVVARIYVELIMLAFKMLETLKKIESKQK